MLRGGNRGDPRRALTKSTCFAYYMRFERECVFQMSLAQGGIVSRTFQQAHVCVCVYRLFQAAKIDASIFAMAEK